MIRGRCSSACVSRSAIFASASSATTFSSALLCGSVRRYEYPAFGVTGVTNDYARGEGLMSCYNLNGVASTDKDALSLTGNAFVPTYDAETMYNPEACVAKDKNNLSYFRGHHKYVINNVSDKHINTTVDLFAKANTAAAWDAVLKDYPSLKTPLDEATRAEITKHYQTCVTIAADQEEVYKLSAPLVRKLLEDKQIHYPLWWRFHEKFVEQLVKNGAGVYDTRAVNLVMERVTKTLLNTWTELPWASDDYVSPIYVDVCGTRQCTEAGMW